MRKNFRQVLLLLFAFKSLSLFANDYDGCMPVTVPNLCSNFDIELDYLIVKPSNSNLDYAVLTHASSSDSPDWRVKSIKPNYHSGFELSGGYVFPNLKNLIRASWTYLYTCDSNSAKAKGDHFLAPFFSVNPQDPAFQIAHGNVKCRFNAVNLNLNQLFDVCNGFRLRLYGGISFVHIEQKLKSSFHNRKGILNLKIHQHSECWGIGPQIGLRSSYQIFRRFNLIAEGAASVLIGNLKGDVHFDSNSIIATELGLSSLGSQRIRRDQATQVFFGFDAKLGLNYCYTFCNESLFKFEVGYRAAIYLDTIQSVNPSHVIAFPVTGAIFATSLEKNKSDFGYHGPYFAFSYDY